MIVALDVDTLEEARELIDILSPVVGIFKVGSQLFTACGPAAVRYLLERDKKVFLDLKFYDIPHTVAHAVSAAVGIHSLKPPQGILMYTVHTQGGREMLEAAVSAAARKASELGIPKPLGLGVTVLTSEEKKDNLANLVLERAALARRSGLDGVVASAQEAQLIRREFGKDFIIVTPGIRPRDSEAGDQKRIATAAEAICSGSDFLVVGRPIIRAPRPQEAARQILEEISQAQK